MRCGTLRAIVVKLMAAGAVTCFDRRTLVDDGVRVGISDVARAIIHHYDSNPQTL